MLSTQSAVLEPQKQYDYHESFFIQFRYQDMTCGAPCFHVSTTNYDVSNYTINQIPFCAQKRVKSDQSHSMRIEPLLAKSASESRSMCIVV